MPLRSPSERSTLVLALAALLCVTGAHAARCEFLIVVAGPSSGAHAAETLATKQGAERAAVVINAHGGIAGEQLNITTADDGCTAATAQAAARNLVERHADLVLGHPCEAAALSAAAVYGPAGVLFIATLNRHAALTAKRAGPSIFRLSGRDDRQGEEVARILASRAGGHGVAIVHDRTRYARRIADAATDALKGLNITAKVVAIVAGEKDYSRQAQELRDADAVFFAGFPLEAGLLLRALRASGSQALFIGSDSIATAEFTETFGAQAKGVMAMAPTRQAADQAAESAVNLVATAASRAGAALDRAKSVQDALDPTSAPVFDTSGDARVASFEMIELSGAEWLRGGALMRQPSR